MSPLTKKGKKVRKAMEEEYGKKKGKQVLYASMNKGNPGSSSWHEVDKKAMKMMGRKK